MIEVDVQYRLTDDGWLTYKATLITIARVDGQWIAIVYDKESETIREVNATDLQQWEM